MSEWKDVAREFGVRRGCASGESLARLCNEILRLRSREAKLLGVVGVLVDAHTSISKNSCCDTCRQAALVSLKALASVSAEMEFEG